MYRSLFFDGDMDEAAISHFAQEQDSRFAKMLSIISASTLRSVDKMDSSSVDKLSESWHAIVDSIYRCLQLFIASYKLLLFKLIYNMKGL